MHWFFSGIVKVTDRLAPQGHADRARQGQEMFEKAQWAQASEAASSLIQMAARRAKGDAVLAGLVRERQDLVAEWQVKDKQLITAKSQSPATRDLDAEKSLSDRLREIDSRLASIDEQLAKNFPNYASLTSPMPASVAEVQAQLRDSEVLVLLLDTPGFGPTMPEETFIWVITKGGMRWVKSELSTKALTELVEALHCGLDHTLWDDAVIAKRCKDLVSASPHLETVTIGGKDEGIEVLPFTREGKCRGLTRGPAPNPASPHGRH
jgi:hypothetical protein